MSWLREVSVMDLSSETVSLAASEATATATTPRDTLPDHGDSLYTDAHSIAWPPWSRRASCQSQSVTGCTPVSTSGQLLSTHDGDEREWWASTWARGSWEGMTAPSPTPESLYDHPRPLAHLQPCCMAPHPPHGSHHPQEGAANPPRLALNPLDNYDIPPPPRVPPPHAAVAMAVAAHYDTPRRLVMCDTGTSLVHEGAGPAGEGGEGGTATSGVWCEGGLASAAPSCGQVLGWAGSLVCGRREEGEAPCELLRVDGHGRMPVVDANTGTILRHPPPPPTPPHHTQPPPAPPQQQQDTAALYAVVNKRKKATGKPRAPTPPPTPSPTPRPATWRSFRLLTQITPTWTSPRVSSSTRTSET